MSRALRIEWLRSNALALTTTTIVIGTLLLYYVDDRYVTWMGLAQSHRSDNLAVMISLVAGFGAWYGRREKQHRLEELLDSTPRSRWQRVLPTAAVMAAAAAAGYLITFTAVAVAVIQPGAYANWAAIAVMLAIGAVTLIAAVFLGLAAGHLVPSRLTAPVLSAVLPVAIVVAAIQQKSENALLLPILTFPGRDTDIVQGRVSALQALWLLAFCVAGYVLFAASQRRGRLLALLPVALAAIVVVPLLPHGRVSDVAYTTDHRATELVCASGTPRVCVSRLHAAVLPQVTAPAREALALLARLPGEATSATERLTYDPADRTNTAWMTFDDLDRKGALSAEGIQLVQNEILSVGAAGRDCPESARDADNAIARQVGVAWLRGEPPAPSALDPSLSDPESQAKAQSAWKALTSLPKSTQRNRVSASRQAAANCDADLYRILTQGTTR
jgi:hypothetical protein